MSEDELRKEITTSQREIHTIKQELLKLETLPVADDDKNSVEFALNKVSGYNIKEEEKKISLQLSSPIEEAFLYELSEEDNTSKGIALFQGVEVSLATLTLSLYDNNSSLNAISDSYEMIDLCKIEDGLSPKEKYTKSFTAVLEGKEEEKEDDEVKEDEGEKEEDKGEKKEENEEDKGEEGDKEEDDKEDNEEEENASNENEDEEDAKEEEKKNEKVVEEEEPKEEIVKVKKEYELSFTVTYKPSIKDRKEELMRLLNSTGEKRDSATKKLRELKAAASSSSARKAGDGDDSTLTTISSTSSGKPAVKSGFLNSKRPTTPSNSKTTADEPSFSKKIQMKYNKYFGPQSLVRMILPVAKNYVLFFAAVYIMHSRGQYVALPAPA